MREQSLAQRAKPRGMHRVRWVEGQEPEMQCAGCYEYLPITVEFWLPAHGLRRCRVCWGEATRARVRASMARHRSDPARLEAEQAARRAEYAANRADRRTYHREWSRRRRSRLAMYEQGVA